MKRKVTSIFKDYFEGVLALLYPEFCIVCKKELNSQNKFICFKCEQNLHYTYFEKYQDDTLADEIFWGRLYVENVYSMLYYEKGNSTQKILHCLKYKQGRELGIHMGKKIGTKIKKNPKYKSVDVLVPIPLHSKKEFLRGYNQSQLIAKGISEELNIPIVEAIYRKTHDESQTKKNREERISNVEGRFALKPQTLQNYKHAMIVDDVLTTGSTLEFAGRTLLDTETPIQISIATIAKTQ